MNNEHEFPVELQPIKVQKFNTLIPKRQAVYRTDTKETIGVVSSAYELISHKDVVNSFREVLKERPHTESIKMLRNGAHLFATYKLDNEEVIASDDKVQLQFIVINSYDGSNSLKVIFGAYRTVCENGLILGQDVFKYSKKHIESNNGLTLDKETLSEGIKSITEHFQDAVKTFKIMELAIIPKIDASLFDAERINISSYLVEKAKVYFEEEKSETVWQYYNSLTKAITHDMRKDNPWRYMDFSIKAWNAAKSQLPQ